ncbi:MAG: translation initiation factor IF-5A [Candidatus Marsarchaeota archaeon]|jgi:translation initiation factor 5A|nr:translation initiation factor IF-5A [Candidatus Marsarchaeota archaeon]
MDDTDMQRESVKKLKSGRYIIIDGIPCRVVNIETSSPGKHGAAKVRITAIGIFDGQKKTILKTSHDDVDVPILKKTKAQVVSITGNNAQLMDPDTYEIYELPIPEDLQGKFSSGSELEVVEVMGQKQISRVATGSG